MKKISDIIRSGHPSVSFEVFPHKRELPLAPVKAAVMAMSRLCPAFVSVTYGAAGGDSSANTSAIASYVEKDCAITALAHLTCVMATRGGIAAEAEKLREAGIGNILALRGDLPPGTVAGASPEHFHHAVELVEFLRHEFPEFCVGGACYPEGHPECNHLAKDIEHLKAKVDAGLDFLTTQMFFDNNIYFHYLARLRDAGIMPVTNDRQIERICRLSGTRLPPRFRAIVDRFGDRPAAMLDAGVAYATDQIIDLFANGVNNVHVYTMNRPEVAERIMNGLGSILKA